jgi:pimeloyl-ACP methyl ester carboxylesterase
MKDPEIFFQKKGRGSYQFALIHNAGANHRMMRKVFSHVSKKGVAVSFDWPGHGKSAPSEDGDYSVAAQAEKIARFLKKQGRKKWVLIGLNFGANLAVEIAACHPEFVSHLVLIEPPILLPPESKLWIEGLIKQLRELSPRAYGKKNAKEVFLFPPTPEDKRIVEKAFEVVDRDMYIATFRGFLQWDKSAVAKLKKLIAPTLHILTTHPFCTDLSSHVPHVITARVVGSGFWATLEVPEQVNAMIDRFLDITNSVSLKRKRL